MKTERYNTSGKSSQTVELDIEKIRQFTKQELSRLTKEKQPLAYKISDTQYNVGRFKVRKVDDVYWKVLDNQKFIHNFCSLRSAIFYCVAAHVGKMDLADSIRKADSEVDKVETQVFQYNAQLNVAKRKGDGFKEDLIQARLQESTLLLSEANKVLEKSLRAAKYIKV